MVSHRDSAAEDADMIRARREQQENHLIRARKQNEGGMTCHD